MTEPLFHLAQPEQWDDARRLGEYRHSTRGLTLDEVGFIHLATAAQWPGVRRRFYADHPGGLVLLTIDPERLDAEVRWEVPPVAGEVGDPSSAELFPHLYGALPVAAVTATSRVAPPHRRP
ncbi:MAG: DUF952 domain-containing protein [Dermatophilaceae bacterium]